MVSYNCCPYILELYKEFYIFLTIRPNSMSQTVGSTYEELIMTNYDPRKSSKGSQISFFGDGADDDAPHYELIHEPTVA